MNLFRPSSSSMIGLLPLLLHWLLSSSYLFVSSQDLLRVHMKCSKMSHISSFSYVVLHRQLSKKIPSSTSQLSRLLDIVNIQEKESPAPVTTTAQYCITLYLVAIIHNKDHSSLRYHYFSTLVFLSTCRQTHIVKESDSSSFFLEMTGNEEKTFPTREMMKC
jgi:hypothetical protein